MCHASYLSFIHEISMCNLLPIPKCLIYTCLHVVTGIGQYWYNNNHINTHTYSMQESFTLYFREVLITIWCTCTAKICHIMPSSGLAHKNTQLIVYKEVKKLKSKQSVCCLFLSTNNYKTVM